MLQTSEGGSICNLHELCEAMKPAFAELGLPAPTAQDVIEQLATERRAQRNVMQARLNARENHRPEHTLLRDERGSAYGEVIAEMDTDHYFELQQSASFGREALGCLDGIKEVTKAFPQTRVKTTGSKYIGRGFNFGDRLQAAAAV